MLLRNYKEKKDNRKIIKDKKRKILKEKTNE